MQLWEYEAVTEADPDDLIIFSRDGVQFYSVSVENSKLKSGLKYWTETETEIYQEAHDTGIGSDILAGNAYISGTGFPRHLGMRWHKKYYETEELLTYGALSALSVNGNQPEEVSPTLITKVENPQDMSSALCTPYRTVNFTYGPKPDWNTYFSLKFGKVNPHFYICRGTLESFCLILTDRTVAPHDGEFTFRTEDPDNKMESVYTEHLCYTIDNFAGNEQEADWHDLGYIFILSCMGSSAYKYTDYQNADYIGFTCDDPQTTTQFGRHGTQETNSVFGQDIWRKTWTPEEEHIDRTNDWYDAFGQKIGTVHELINTSYVGEQYGYLPCGISTVFDYKGATWFGIMVPEEHYFGRHSTIEQNKMYISCLGPDGEIDNEELNWGSATRLGKISDNFGKPVLHPALRGSGYISKYTYDVVQERLYEYQLEGEGSIDHRKFYSERYHGFSPESLEQFRKDTAENANTIFKILIDKYLKLNVYTPKSSGDGGSDGIGIKSGIGVEDKKAYSAGILNYIGDVEQYFENVNVDPLKGISKFSELWEKHDKDETKLSDILQVKLKPTDGIHISDNNVISATFNEDVGEILQEKILPGDGVGVTYNDTNDTFIFSKNHSLIGYVSSLGSRVPVYSARSTDQQTGEITDELYFNIADLKEKVEVPTIAKGAGIDISVTGNTNTISSYGITKVSVNGAVQVKTTESGQTYIDIDSSAFNPNRTRSRSAINTKYISGYPVEYIKKENGYFSKDVDLSDLFNRVAALEQAVINQGGA